MILKRPISSVEMAVQDIRDYIASSATLKDSEYVDYHIGHIVIIMIIVESFINGQAINESISLFDFSFKSNKVSTHKDACTYLSTRAIEETKGLLMDINNY